MHIRRIPIILVAFFAFVSIAANQSDIQKKASDDLLAGRNVNMVSGDVLPGGDPWLQRQNEPSIAVSTRNTQHLLAGANDYRTVDISDDFELPGINETAAGDAWLGVFKSYDGGKSWVSTLLPGFPQDISVEGNLSPLKGYQAAADPVVRAGTDGMFYFAGIAFNRDRTKSVVFISRFFYQHNSERRDSIEYIDTHIVQSFDFPPGEAEKFIDKPWIAVDVPRGDSTLMTINTQRSIRRKYLYLLECFWAYRRSKKWDLFLSLYKWRDILE